MPGDIEITSTSGLLRHITIFYMQGLSIGPRTFSSALTNLQPALAQGPLKLYLGLSTRGEKGVGYQAIPPPPAENPAAEEDQKCRRCLAMSGSAGQALGCASPIQLLQASL